MKKFIILSLFMAFMVSAADETLSEKPQQAALAFNKWYIGQFADTSKNEINVKKIEKYVTARTLKTLRHAVGNDSEYYDADFFIKAQDIGDDWQSNVAVVSSEYDPVCTNVYVSFGKDHEHTIIDCMVKEGGRWKVQSVARVDISPNEAGNR